jgi:hypothetical protein
MLTTLAAVRFRLPNARFVTIVVYLKLRSARFVGHVCVFDGGAETEWTGTNDFLLFEHLNF